MSLFGIYLFYTWLAMTPHRRPGSNKVQESSTTLAHKGRQGYSATKNTDRHTNGFNFTHTEMDKKPHRWTNSKSLDTRKNPLLLLEWGRQPVWATSSLSIKNSQMEFTHSAKNQG